MIPLIDIQAQTRELRSELSAALERVLDSCQFALGAEVSAFENAFADFVGVRHAVACSSGTSALHLALLAAGVEPGDEVITVPFTFVATAAAIEYCGARPVLVDIDPVTYCMDPGAVEGAITGRTRAIMPVHLYGQPADMDPILEIARRHGLKVVEDAAQAHGAEYRGRRAGGLGEVAAFSFYPTKNLGACGEGGAITTDDDVLAERLRMLRDWGQQGKYNHVLKGFNYRMDGFQGAVLGVKLRHLDEWTEARQTLAMRYDEALADTPLVLPVVAAERTHVYHLYPVRFGARDRLAETLRERGVATALHYPIPIHLQPAYADLGYSRGDFPHSEQCASEVISLPLYPELTPQLQDQVVEAIKASL